MGRGPPQMPIKENIHMRSGVSYVFDNKKGDEGSKTRIDGKPYERAGRIARH